jgi:hypothetical protein
MRDQAEPPPPMDEGPATTPPPIKEEAAEAASKPEETAVVGSAMANVVIQVCDRCVYVCARFVHIVCVCVCGAYAFT